jgi:DNA-directed RNA polymerase specialized sigma24 family protein
MSTKLKELKDDALINVQVNKSYYFMVKLELFNAVEDIVNTAPEEAKDLDKILEKKYEDLTPKQRTVFTLSLLVAEIERVANKEGLFIEVDPSTITED